MAKSTSKVTDEPSTSADTSTAGQTPAEAAATSREGALDPATAETGTTTLAEAVDAGYLGVSPAREATGQADKGLSQQTPEVMRRAGDEQTAPQED